ncbi:DNA-processing protein DprA [Craurococcus roseus]|uniref:DNA-processing protein DprA n=1 Tax=Craurococcus roseus TaxID=77585 RepID=A0ABN1F3Y2_9PROT
MTGKVVPAIAPADAVARLRLARTDGIGPQTFRRLLERFGSAAAALEEMPGYGRGRLRAPPEAEALREMDAVAALGGSFLFLGTPGYPPLLDTLTDPPAVLALLGDPAALGPRAVAVVGARNASAAGRRIADDLAESLAAHGLVVVSGMARGIDAAAHQGAMRKGRTVAVVACGLDQPYPPEHAPLQARIAAEGGAVLAEAPLGTAPHARHFPRRNRIVAGLSLGVVLVEAAVRSGSLITARLGLEAGREIFAVPGSPLDERCRGCNDLIRQGAHLTEGPEDVLAHLPQTPDSAPAFVFRPTARNMPAPATRAGEAREPSGDEAQVLDLLGPSPIAVDDVLRRCQLSAPVVQAILLDLELSGRAEMLPGNRVALTGKG